MLRAETSSFPSNCSRLLNAAHRSPYVAESGAHVEQLLEEQRIEIWCSTAYTNPIRSESRGP